jgi:hypothetical protein
MPVPSAEQDTAIQVRSTAAPVGVSSSQFTPKSTDLHTRPGLVANNTLETATSVEPSSDMASAIQL